MHDDLEAGNVFKKSSFDDDSFLTTTISFNQKLSESTANLSEDSLKNNSEKKDPKENSLDKESIIIERKKVSHLVDNLSYGAHANRGSKDFHPLVVSNLSKQYQTPDASVVVNALNHVDFA